MLPTPPTALDPLPEATGGDHVPNHRSDGAPISRRAARKRADRLAKASPPTRCEAALAYLSMIDPEAFEIALTVVAQDADEARGRRAHPAVRAPAAPRSPSSPKSPSTGVTSVATPPPPVPIETYDAEPRRRGRVVPPRTRLRRSSSMFSEARCSGDFSTGHRASTFSSEKRQARLRP